jgi:hypothetical protein
LLGPVDDIDKTRIFLAGTQDVKARTKRWVTGIVFRSKEFLRPDNNVRIDGHYEKDRI